MGFFVLGSVTIDKDLGNRCFGAGWILPYCRIATLVSADTLHKVLSSLYKEIVATHPMQQ